MRKRNNKEIIKKEEEFQQRIIDVARVTRVMAGGKRMKFRVCLAIGDKKGRVGYAIAKGPDVTIAITKAVNRAKKKLINIPIVNETIPHTVNIKYKSAKILLRPAQKGTGIKAGGAVRILCELAGIPNVTSKILGSSNKINNVRATMEAFGRFKKKAKMQVSQDLAREEKAKSPNQPEIAAKELKDNKEKKQKISLKDKLKKIVKKGKTTISE